MPARDAAIARYTEIVNSFAPVYQSAWRDAFGAKLGLAAPGDADVDLITEFLALMAELGADFTNTFRALTDNPDAALEHQAFSAWRAKWQARGPDHALMAQSNPAIIPRNHRVEEAIQSAGYGDWGPFHALHSALGSPYARPEDPSFTTPPTPAEEVRQTFCGT